MQLASGTGGGRSCKCHYKSFPYTVDNEFKLSIMVFFEAMFALFIFFSWLEFQENSSVPYKNVTSLDWLDNALRMLTPVSWWLEVIMTSGPVPCGTESAGVIHCLLVYVCSRPQMQPSGA